MWLLIQLFSFKRHVLNICRSVFYHIRDLRRFRTHLNKATAISLANALVSSRLDYCNLLLFGCSEKYITSSLKLLHWLAIKSCIKFKLNLLTYKALFIHGYSYLSDLLHFENRMQTPRSGARSKRNYGHSSFEVSACAPRLWDKLPFEIYEARSVTIFR